MTEEVEKNKIEKTHILRCLDGLIYSSRRNFNYSNACEHGILRVYLGKIFLGQIFAPGGTMPLGGLSES